LSRRVYHVVPAGEAWIVRRERGTRAKCLYRMKRQAIACARAMGKAIGPAQVKVHGRCGRVLTEFTYGEDPHQTKN
jgi:hypothetical protein